MFPVTDNPADRLIKILTEAKAQNSNTINEAFSKVCGYKSGDKVSFYRAFGHLNELLDQVESRVKAIPDLRHELYLRDIPAIRSVITPGSMDNGWSSMSQPLHQGALTCLDFCSDVLSKNHQEAAISKDEIDKIKLRITALYKIITESELDVSLKTVLFDLITTMQSAIDNYKIKGAEGLKRSLVYASGLINLHQSRLEESKNAPSVKEIFVFVKDVAVIVTAAYKMKELGGDMANLLRLTASE